MVTRGSHWTEERRGGRFTSGSKLPSASSGEFFLYLFRTGNGLTAGF